MNIYSNTNYTSFFEYKKQLLDEIKKVLINEQVTVNETLTTIIDCEWFGDELKVYLANTKIYVLDRALASGAIKISEGAQSALDNIKAHYEASKSVHTLELEERARIQALELAQQREEQEARRKALELKKQEQELKIKREKKIKNALAKLENLKPLQLNKLFDTPSNFYEAIGWMAKHTKTIHAAMPDYMEKWFVAHFGDVERYVVDSNKKTSGGFNYQWGLGLKISFDAAVSGVLEQEAGSQNKKLINNVGFVWKLVEDFGFKFGNKQDLEAIRAEIPKGYLQDFEAGFNM